MRTADATTLARRYAASQRVAWLLELAQDDWTWRGATREATFDGKTFAGTLAAVERWSETIPGDDWPGGRITAEATVRIIDDPGSDTSLRERLAANVPVGMHATLRLAWLGSAGAAANDAPAMLCGRICDWSVEAGAITLKLIDELEAMASRPCGRLLHAGMLGGEVSESLGEALPWIFGYHPDLELMPLVSGAASTLASAMDADSTMIMMTSSENFPPQGQVQIGSEIIEYTYLSQTFNQIGSSLAPVTRGSTPTAHAKGATVRAVPGEGFTWLVADHPCLSVYDALADGSLVRDAAWGDETTTLDGRTVQIVRMDAWPLDEGGNMASRVSAKVNGLGDDSIELIVNPVDILTLLLSDERLGGLDEALLDEDSFAAARTALDSANYVFTRRLDGDETLGDAINSALREAGLWAHPGETITLSPIEPSPWPQSSEEALDEKRTLEATGFSVRAPDGRLPPDALELIGVEKISGEGKPSYRFPPESSETPTIPKRLNLKWLDLDEEEPAGDLGEMLWAQYEQPFFRRQMRWPLGAALLKAGEIVTLGEAALQMEEIAVWLRSLELNGAGAIAALVSGPWVSGDCWRGDSLNFIRRFGFGQSIDCVLAGRPVARISRKGTLRLRGTLAEGTDLSSTSMSGPVAIIDEEMYFGVGADETYEPFLAIDADGNARLSGTLRETSTLTFETNEEAFGADEESFWLSPDAHSGAFEYADGNGILHLAGILIENTRL